MVMSVWVLASWGSVVALSAPGVEPPATPPPPPSPDGEDAPPPTQPRPGRSITHRPTLSPSPPAPRSTVPDLDAVIATHQRESTHAADLGDPGRATLASHYPLRPTRHQGHSTRLNRAPVVVSRAQNLTMAPDPRPSRPDPAIAMTPAPDHPTQDIAAHYSSPWAPPPTANAPVDAVDTTTPPEITPTVPPDITLPPDVLPKDVPEPKDVITPQGIIQPPAVIEPQTVIEYQDAIESQGIVDPSMFPQAMPPQAILDVQDTIAEFTPPQIVPPQAFTEPPIEVAAPVPPPIPPAAMGSSWPMAEASSPAAPHWSAANPTVSAVIAPPELEPPRFSTDGI